MENPHDLYTSAKFNPIAFIRAITADFERSGSATSLTDRTSDRRNHQRQVLSSS
ncbi:hypothetical protein M1D47_22100 [Bacillus sp. R1-10]